MMAQRFPRTLASLFTAVVLGGLAALAPASAPAGSFMSWARFKELAAAASTPDFRIPANPVIYRSLVKKFGHAGGRNWARHCLDHRQRFQPIFDEALERHGLPRQLAAVPFVEAGFRNLGSDDPLDQVSYELGPVGRGLWMFISPTARAYGLQVGDGVDERLDPLKATDAALQFLTDLHGRFGSWALAFAAYHRGGSTVRRAIREEGTRDPWKLIDSGALTPYAARIMSAAIVLHEPSVVYWPPAPEGDESAP